MTIEIVDLPIQNGGSFHSYVNVYQRVGIHSARAQHLQPGDSRVAENPRKSARLWRAVARSFQNGIRPSAVRYGRVKTRLKLTNGG